MRSKIYDNIIEFFKSLFYGFVFLSSLFFGSYITLMGLGSFVFVFSRFYFPYDIKLLFMYLVIILIGFLIISVITLAFFNTNYGLLKKKKNRRTCFTVLFIFCSFLLGFVFINLEYGANIISLDLNNHSDWNDKEGVIKCFGDSGYLIVGDGITCRTHPNFTNIQGNVTSELWDGQLIYQDLIPYNSFFEYLEVDDANMRFFAHNNTRRIHIEFSATNESGYPFYLSTGESYPLIKFLDKEDYQERKDKYLGYMIALIVGILFSVPSAIVNIRKMMKEN